MPSKDWRASSRNIATGPIRAAGQSTGSTSRTRSITLSIACRKLTAIGQNNRDSKIRIILINITDAGCSDLYCCPRAGRNHTIYPPMRKDRPSPPPGGGRSRLLRVVLSMINEDDIRGFRGILAGVVVTALGGVIIWLALLFASH